MPNTTRAIPTCKRCKKQMLQARVAVFLKKNKINNCISTC